MNRCALLAICAALSLGCRQILGIEELAPTDAGASDARETDVAVDGPGPGDAAAEALPLCGPPDASLLTSAELEWALWPMPNSPVDVDAGAPNPERYVVNADDTVTDALTGLVWQRTLPSADAFVFTDAVGQCAGLSVAGQHDWQLPTYIELVSLVDLAEQSPNALIDPSAFPNAPNEVYWSSTPAAGTMMTKWWSVSFLDGKTSTDAPSGKHHARCVRRPGRTVIDGGAACTRYVVDAGSVTDTMTGLTWESTSPKDGGASQAAASRFCAMRGWRLATGDELLTIVDVTRYGPAVDPSVFTLGGQQVLWSASPVAGPPADGGWVVDFSGGSRSEQSTSMVQTVLCVR
jgi:hypothetical protein